LPADPTIAESSAMLRLAAAVFALTVASCSSVETVNGRGFVLSSPFGPEATAKWAGRVERELGDVAALLQQPVPQPPIEVRLEAVSPSRDDDLLARLHPGVDGAAGWTLRDQVHVYVARERDGLFSMSVDGVLRHEFVHALLARPPIPAPAWLGEGLAHEAQFAVRGAGGLHLHPVPEEFVLARMQSRTAVARRLWTWEAGRPHQGDEESAALRRLSRSFVRFLIEREGEAWPRAVAQWARLHPESDPSLVDAWLAWLDGWDFAARVERGIHDGDPDVRAAAAGRLPVMAEYAARLADPFPGIERVIDSRTDGLAVELASSRDAECAEAAGRYLAFFRYRSIPEADLDRLMADDLPAWTRLVALAVAARRDVGVEPAIVKPIWESLAQEDQARFRWLLTFLPLPPASDDRRGASRGE
jgi:hypothetical protein